jgi:hypothetical protein
MNRSRSVTLALAGTALASGLAIAAFAANRSAHAQGAKLVRDFYGEADEEVTGAAAVPAGMVCGGTASVGSGLIVQTTEPPEGFTGACLMNRAYGSPLLPSVCFSPANGTFSSLDTLAPGSTKQGSVKCTAPATSVLQPEWHLSGGAGAVTRSNFDGNYRIMETCVPHGECANYPNSNCPCDTMPVSNSCCTHRGTRMTSSDGKTASGTAYFTLPPNLPVYGN